jgi:hypothetical protein
MSKALIDKRDWMMGGVYVVESEQWRALQRLGSDEQGYEYVVLHLRAAARLADELAPSPQEDAAAGEEHAEGDESEAELKDGAGHGAQGSDSRDRFRRSVRDRALRAVAAPGAR